MQILIIANGNLENVEFYRDIVATSDVIIAADGGADHCLRLSVKPDLVIGDFDSISERAKETFKDRLKHDPDESKTDVQLALEVADEKEPDSIVLIGAIGTRLDHTLANLFSLDNVAYPVKIIDEHNEVYLVKDRILLCGEIGDKVSIIALTDVSGLTYGGLKYPVMNMEVPAGWQGVSNEFTSSEAFVGLSSGKVIAIKSRD